MKTQKHILQVFCLSAVLLLTTLLVHGENVQAASAKTKALKAYGKLMAKSKTADFTQNSSSSFALAYIDNDKIPELIIQNFYGGMIKGNYAVYTYRNGKVKRVAGPDTLGTSISYYKKKGVIRGSLWYTVPMGGPGEGTTYCQMKKGKIVSILKKEVFEPNEAYGRTKTESSWFYDTSGKGNKFKSLSKKSFNSKLKKMTGSKKPTTLKSIKFYENTAANRKKYLK